MRKRFARNGGPFSFTLVDLAILAISAHPLEKFRTPISPGTFDKTCFLFKVSAPERRRTEDSGAFFDGADRRNVKSDRGRLIEKR
jgi:hypothetical protein